MYSSERSIHFKKHAQKLLKTKDEQRKNKNKQNKYNAAIDSRY